MTDTAELIHKLRARALEFYGFTKADLGEAYCEVVLADDLGWQAASRLASLQEEVERLLDLLKHQKHDAECRDATYEAELERMREALKPFALYGEKREEMPLKGLGESVHLIHASTPFQAEITMEHIRRARSALSPVSEGER